MHPRLTSQDGIPSPDAPPSREAAWPNGHADSSFDMAPEQASDDPTTAGTSSDVRTSPSSAQKRRRVARACDECRRKKIKCDGKQPCTHCTVYSYDCTYDQPSNRRRNPAPQHYIEELENRLQRAEAIIKTHLPEVDLADPRFGLQPTRPRAASSTIRPLPRRSSQEDDSTESESGEGAGDPDADSLLESMVEMTGQLDLDDMGFWDFHGHSSGLSFIRRMRQRYGDLMGPDSKYTPFVMPKAMAQVDRTSSRTCHGRPPDDGCAPNVADLPPKPVAQALVSNAVDDGCSVLLFVHRPTVDALVTRIYDLPATRYGDEELRFLPLLYAILAFGCLFAKAEQSELAQGGYVRAIRQGFQYFNICRSMIDITDCRNLDSLQALMFMILFLQSSARLTKCYAYIGIAQRSAIRMGLHRSLPTPFNPIEQETRKRVFWVIRKMDTYVACLLGLPKSLSDKDIDQDLPAEVDDECITADGIAPQPPGKFPLVAGSNAQTRLVKVLTKIIKYIYPIKGFERRVDGRESRSYMVSYARVREIEQDMQAWMDELPMQLRIGEAAAPDLARTQQLLRMTYAYTQMMLYRPFLHYVSAECTAKTKDPRAYACAAACVSVCRNLIHITTQMKKSGLLMGAYWFAMYTTFFSILSLVYYALENPNEPTTLDMLKDAEEGKETLASLSKRSLAADRCTVTLTAIFEQLPDRLKQGRQKPTTSKKRQAPASTAGTSQTVKSSSSSSIEKPRRSKPAPTSMPKMPNVLPPNRSTSSLSQPSPHRTGMEPMFLMSPRDSYSPSDLSQTSGSHPASVPSTQQTPYSTQPPPPHQSQQSQPPQPSMNEFLDLNAMMFPSADPFAYPNNPMTIFEDQQQKRGMMDVSMGNPMIMSDAINNNIPYDNLEVRLYDPLPPYLAQQGQTAAHRLVVPVGATTPATPTSGIPGCYAPLVDTMTGTAAGLQPGFSLDQIFGNNEWGSSGFLPGRRNQHGYPG